jgi:hypothetical protein
MGRLPDIFAAKPSWWQSVKRYNKFQGTDIP